ncbi:FkbM family methyltransferase [Rhabdochlamydiaceae symbiont of Dictyostelium giganteum]|uniref:FkbM family methyltransferase n=1 Tax=Rhabdochlamydiaceae symbiont of Dictyostelium giganteum TaxID=3342349 RepID=UPI003850A9A6
MKMKKSNKLSEEIQKSQILYRERENKSLFNIIEEFSQGELDKYEYILEMHDKYSTLFELKKLIKKCNIKSISIDSDFVKFHLDGSNLTLIADNACRSALFESLNFGSYEQEEMQMIENLIGEKDVIFDIGAHLGWYSIQLAYLRKHATIYGFEPVAATYHLFKKNIELNELTNINYFNFGFSDKEKMTNFYYSEAGSAIASEQDIFEVNTLGTVECYLKRLDDFVLDKKISQIDFIKCDVEGAEFLVLKGGQNSIKKFSPILFLELVENWCNMFSYTIQELIVFLFDLGYKMFEIQKGHLKELNAISTESIDNFNYLFLHGKKHEHLISKFSSK